MVSTLASLNLVNSDLQASLKRTAADPIVSRDAQYYRENIGSVTSVDDFVDDYRLFSYAMKAYGLEDMTYAKAFMKKVLESDLSDDQSFANKLADERYRDFAAAFNFGTDGAIKMTPVDAQSDAQEDDTIGLYTQVMQDKLTSVDTETAYYEQEIGGITSLDGFLSDQRLVDYALKANDIDPAYYSPDTLRKVLTSDLSDPDSFVNRLGGKEYLDLAKSFNFLPDGSLAPGISAQTADQTLGTTADYGFLEAGTLTPQMAAENTDYFNDKMASITSVDQLMDDDRLYTYTLTAFGFDPYGTDADTIRKALTSDSSDPDSFANTATGGDYSGLASLFDFSTDGSVPAGSSALSGDALKSVADAYMDSYDAAAAKRVDNATDYFKSASQKITSVDDLMKDDRLYDFVLEAYGIDPDSASKSVVRRALSSDPNDPASYVSRLHDQRYDALAAAFNFAPGGEVEAPNVAQATAAIHKTETAYAALVTNGTVSKEQAKTETAYYDANIGRVASLDDLLADSRLLDYALTAAGLDSKSVTTEELRKALTSDFSDPESYANTEANPKLREFAATFNFRPDGSLGQEETDAPQSMVNIVKTGDLYTRQTLEENEGEENTGVRLALYFERQAPNIDSAYDILADSALLQVVQTALGLSTYTSAADIDIQAVYIDSHIDLSDFQDSDKLQKFLAQFATMYDAENGTTSDPTLTLLSGTSGSTGISADVMLSIAQLGSG